MQAPEAATARRLPPATLYGRRAAAAAVRWISALADRPLTTLAALAAVHWVALLAYALSVPHNGWLYYQGGDQIWLTTTGWLLGQGDLGPPEVGYGWPLVLAPITMVTGPNFVDAMPWVIVLNAIVLAPLALWGVYGLAARIAGRAFGLLAAAVWVLAPYVVIPLWRADYHERYVEQFLPQPLGLTALADYQSMVLLLVGALLFVRALETRAPLDAVAAGLVVGFAVGVKPSNGLFLGAPVAAAVFARNLRPLLPFGLALLPALATLTLWKQRGFGSVPAFAFEETRLATGAVVAAIPGVERYVDLDWANLQENGNHLREYFWSARLLEWLPIAGAIGVARRSAALAALLTTWFATFLIVKGSTPLSTVASGSFFRFVMPAFPAYLLLAVSTLLLVPTLGRAMARRWPLDGERRPLDRRLVAVLAVSLAAVPFAVVALVTPIATPEQAIAVNTILTPVDERIDVDVVAEGAARTLTWSHPAVGASKVFYRVYRTPADGVEMKCLDHGGASECLLEMDLLGTTRERRWRDGAPPPGVRYRVGVAANSRNDATAGDVVALSPTVAAG